MSIDSSLNTTNGAVWNPVLYHHRSHIYGQILPLKPYESSQIFLKPFDGRSELTKEGSREAGMKQIKWG